MDTTPNLALPYIAAAQAQKHVTHNEAIRALDALVQLSVIDRDVTVPPAAPVNGDRYIVPAAASGAWADHAGKIVAFQDGAWAFYQMAEGWVAWVADEGILVVWDGAAWVEASGGGGVASVNPVPLVGVNATADATNKLTVKSDVALFSHDDVTPGTGDMRQVLNKATAGNTVSQLYQSNWSGRAETGLAGDDDFHIKVSPDGATWKEAIVVDRTSGSVAFPNTPGLSGSGEANTSSNTGAGAGIAKAKVGSDLPFKSLVAGTNITITPGTDEITIAATGSGSGEANTASNVNVGGVGMFKQKTAENLEFRGLNAASSKVSVALDGTNNKIDIDVIEANLTLGNQSGSIDLGGAKATGILAAARFGDTSHGSRSGGSLHAAATGAAAGFMSAADKTKLDGVAAGANAYAHPNHSGDVVSTGDGATTIANDAVNNAKLANMATQSIKGRSSVGTGDPEDLSGTQATALLDTFTSTLKGLAPASGGGTASFLRADGTWALPPGGGRETLTAERTYYVRTDGSDGNDGLANTSGGAFLTVQKAIDTAAKLDLAGFNITISIGAGTFSGKVTIPRLVGQAAPSSLTITGAGATTILTWNGAYTDATIYCGTAGAAAHVTNLKVQNTSGASSGCAINVENGGLIDVGPGVVIGTTGWIALRAATTGVLLLNSGLTVSANASFIYAVQFSGYIEMSGTHALGTRTVTATVSAESTGIVFRPGPLTFTGTVTGKRYQAITNAVIETNAGGANVFPGSTAGTTATGGQYAA